MPLDKKWLTSPLRYRPGRLQSWRMRVDNPQKLFELTGSEVAAVGVTVWTNSEPGPGGQGSTTIGFVRPDGSRRMLILAPGCELVDPEIDAVIEQHVDQKSVKES